MTSLTKDPLLAIATGILLFLQGVLALAGTAAAIGIPLLLFNGEKVLIAIHEETAKMPDVQTVWWIAGLLVIFIVMLALGFVFFDKLRRIVSTVGIGDPFVPENAQRLTAMAWLMLAIQVITIPFAAIAFYIAEIFADEGAMMDGDFDPSGIILVITLFILARVFRKGTQMRDELEGTV